MARSTIEATAADTWGATSRRRGAVWAAAVAMRAPGHLGCWVGESPGKSTYILCLEQGATAKQCTVTTRHATGAKVPNGSRTAPMRNAAQAVRATIDKLS